MFETITDEDKRGQVGIGTLIVFIAMVLVAAIAAGVLINTAGSLQSQASDTGTETQQAVANQIEVVHAVAERQNTDTEPDFDELRLIVKKSAGSDVIDMTSVTVQYTSDNTSTTIVHEEADQSVDAPTFITYDAGEYDGYGDTPTTQDSLTETGDRVALIIDLSDDNDLDEPLEPGDSSFVEIVDQSGAKFSYGVTMPQTINDDEQTIAEV
ncbi:archaellin/type IV pilin N-terminal domain-containing protein [Natronosalvus amylolyticus]|uniref:archaellin/type IV pilin N-terminal domain-containing protein n=1 Tax=Natronosalvus amylolyticus TaxID=2961994 RepID=UPI0020C9AFC0|nr:archaellin/type IV pilin N-terminal domain-containing protein [Natronosalvus amylolyticus]